jgi:hypothetical protein
MLSNARQWIYAILDSPRYSTGYTSLFNTIGFVVETHMLKNMLIG